MKMTTEDTTTLLAEYTSQTEAEGNGTDTTTAIPNLATNVHDPKYWTIYLAYIITPVIMIVGIFGNASVIFIMRSKHFRTTTAAVFLTALAISDTKYLLLFPFNKNAMQDLVGQDLRALTVSGCKAFFCIFRSAKIVSSWLIVLICIERFYVVWFPLHAKTISTQRTARIVVTCIFIIVYTFDGVWAITTSVVNGVCLPNYPSAENKALSGGFVIAGITVYDVIPSIILVSLTPLTIFKLIQQRSRRRQMAGTATRKDETYRITRMLVAVTIAYIMLATPIGTAHCVAFFTGDTIFESEDPEFIIFSEIAQICEHLNAVVNFLVYVNYNSTFRRHFCRVFMYCHRISEPVVPENLENRTPSTDTSDGGKRNDTVKTICT